MVFNANIPLATNQISADLVSMNANWEHVIHGDGPAHRTERQSLLRIEAGTVATIKCTLTSVWNGDVIAVVDNIGKDATTGDYWTLNAGGTVLTIEREGLESRVHGILGSFVYGNTTTTEVNIKCVASAYDLAIYFYDATDGTQEDITALVAAGGGSKEMYISVTYITDSSQYGIFYPVVSGDDGHVTFSTETFYSVSATEVWVGPDSGVFIRFVNVTIPKDTSITRAFLRVNCHYGDTDTTFRSKVYVVQADDQAAPTDYAEYAALSLDAGVDCDIAVARVTDEDYDMTDIASGLTTLFARAGWATGQAVVIVINDDGSDTGANFGIHSIDEASGSHKPELHIEWT